MPLLPFPASLAQWTLSTLVVGGVVLFSYEFLPAQALREDAVKPTPTRTSPAEFRSVQGRSGAPVTPAADPLLAQNTEPVPQPPSDGAAQPAPAPVVPPVQSPNQNQPGGPPTQGPGGGFGPGGGGFGPGGGGFGGRGRGAGGGFGGSQGSDAETFRIDGDKVSLQFPNNSIVDILGIYERLTNKTLIKDTTIFEGQTISLMTPQPVERAEAIKLIEAAMLTNGYVIVADPDGKSARILPTRSQGASAAQFSQGVRFYQSAADLPTNETIVSFYMKLDNLEPELAAQILSNHVGLGVYGRITAVTTPPGLLITESANIVRQLVSIKDVIDQPDDASSLITKFIPLKYADAATVAQIVQSTLAAQATESQEKGLTTIRGEQRQGQPQQGQPPQQQQQQPQAQRQGNQQNSQRITPTPRLTAQVIADPRLNQILVVAEPADYTYVASLVSEFDKVVDVPIPFERKLKNVYSVDVISVLADLLVEASGTGNVQLPGGGTLAQNQQPLTTSSSQLLTGRSTTNRGGTFTTSTGGTGTTTDGSSATSRADQLLEAQQDNAPISVLIKKTRVIADPLANSIIVIGPQEDKDKVDMLLDKLDRKPPQVYLATVIGQLTLGKDYQFGIDYLQKFTKTGRNSGMTSSLLATREDIVNNNNVSDITNNLITSAIGNAKGLNVYGQLGDSVDAFVNALEGTSKFKVLSRPSVFALNNKRASITSGQKIPVPSQSITNASTNNNGTGNVTTTIEFRDVVLKLEVIPLINPDGEITLQIVQINDSVVGNQVVDNNTIPIIGTEELKTTVTVPSGNTIVLGGLISETETKNTEGIPVISRIPGLGRLFKEEISAKERKELIVFIQPVVVTDTPEMQRASLAEDMRTKVGEETYKTFPDRQVPPAELVPETPAPAKKKRWFNFGKDSPPQTAPAPAKAPTNSRR